MDVLDLLAAVQTNIDDYPAATAAATEALARPAQLATGPARRDALATLANVKQEANGGFRAAADIVQPGCGPAA